MKSTLRRSLLTVVSGLALVCSASEFGMLPSPAPEAAFRPVVAAPVFNAHPATLPTGSWEALFRHAWR